MKELLKAMRCVLCATVTAKNESRFWLAQFTRHLEGGRDELRAVFSEDLVGDDPTRKQIQDHTGIKVLARQLKAGHITDPDLIGLDR